MGKSLVSLEYMVLAVLLEEPHDAYGVTIRERLKKAHGRNVSVGALYTTLERLEQKKLIESEWGEKTPERGGRRKRYYKIKGSGVEAVRDFWQTLSTFEPEPV